MDKNMFQQIELQLIVYDFDGVMTDNTAILDENGKESVIVNRGDGYAVGCIKKEGISQIILSTEKNNVVSKRADKLGIEVIHGVESKKEILAAYCKAHNYEPEKVLFIGNDLNDMEAMKIVGFTACPKDAEPEIRNYVDYIFESNGGKGVVRELYRLLFPYIEK